MACKPLIVVSGMKFEAAMVRGENIRTVYGLNPAKLEADMEAAITVGACGIISFGTAAGLLPALHPGSIVIARQVKWQKEIFKTDVRLGSRLLELLPDATTGSLAGADTPIATRTEKAFLFADSGAVAADMESQHVARIAQKHALPFAVLRVVLDAADCTLPPAALAATKPDGNVDYLKLMKSLIAQPRQLKALIRLGGYHAKAKQSLLRCSHFLDGRRLGLVHLDS